MRYYKYQLSLLLLHKWMKKDLLCYFTQISTVKDWLDITSKLYRLSRGKDANTSYHSNLMWNSNLLYDPLV